MRRVRSQMRFRVTRKWETRTALRSRYLTLAKWREGVVISKRRLLVIMGQERSPMKLTTNAPLRTHSPESVTCLRIAEIWRPRASLRRIAGAAQRNWRKTNRRGNGARLGAALG